VTAKIGQRSTIYADIPGGTKPHLFVCLTEAFGNPEKVVLVNLSSARGYRFEDHTVVLEPGDHPYIKHKSYVAFGYARKALVEKLNSRITEGSAELREEVSEEVFERILDGLRKSVEVPVAIKRECRQQGLIR